MVEEISKGEKKKFSGRKLLNSCRKNPWIISTVALGIVVLVLMFTSFSSSGCTGNVISEEEASQKLLDLYTSQGVSGLEVSSVKQMSGVYQVNFDYQGQEVPIFITSDGKMVGSLSEIPSEENTESSAPSTSQTVPKSDKPVVELFIMTHCPYGTQAEKGFIPFLDAFGENVDGKIRFVHYFMHGDVEEEETYRELCIREEQGDKYLDYLKCFLSGNGVVDPNYGLVMEGKDQETCMNEVGVDINKVEQCVSNGNAEKYYTQDSQLSQSYGVQGSPTLVINGVIASSGRSASAYLSTACSAFNNEPSECSSLNLSSESPTPYFGWDTSSGVTSAGSC